MLMFERQMEPSDPLPSFVYSLSVTPTMYPSCFFISQESDNITVFLMSANISRNAAEVHNTFILWLKLYASREPISIVLDCKLQLKSSWTLESTKPWSGDFLGCLKLQ